MNCNELKSLIKKNQSVYFEGHEVKIIELFEFFNIAEIEFEDKNKIIVDVSLLSNKKIKNKENSINIF
ncbi:hypothetical protein BFS06_14435 [Clostridium perfringens]|uniref:Uncharacterized protein n=1 Tax=Clostridium perfringens TaxID=1502 RepID=A0A140GRC2_CLOPF|nr:hypothetical protein [Clostridium perfringens]AMN31081.1 hypothetical protein JFP838_pA0165 [Clostridium perfringens]TBX14404.1 hypothetical protein BFS06_14435 [Clostridium perfringens]